MPDQFGQETPQEAVQRVRAGFAQQRAQFNRSALANNKYALLGQSLGNIFGGTIRKSLDTRDARKSEAQRLYDAGGINMKEARAMAKESVPRDFREVRRAKHFKEASSVATNTFAQLKGVIGPVRAQAAADTVYAAKLRSMGYPDDATKLTMRADASLKAEDQADIGRRKLKADLRSSEATADLDELKVRDHGLHPVEQMTATAERLKARIDAWTPADPDSIEVLNEKLEWNTGMRSALIFRSHSDADLKRLGQGASDRIQLDILDDTLLLERMTGLENVVLNHKGKFAATTVGAFGAGFASFLEGTFGLDPGTYGADTLISDVQEISSNAGFVSAAIRHALTGAAMSAQEAPLLEPFLAQPGDSPTQMLAKIRAVKKYTALDIKTRTEFARMMSEDEYKSVPPAMVATLNAFRAEATAEIKAERAASRANNGGRSDSTVALDDDVQAAIDVGNRK